MTWLFNPSGETFDAYDPSGTEFATDVAFSGRWPSDGAPTEFYTEAASQLQNAPDVATGLRWAGELIADDIQEGTL